MQAQQTLSVRIIDKNGRVPEIDEYTNGLLALEYEHHEIHEGDHYNVCNYSEFGNGASTDFTIITPDTTKWAHMTFEIEGSYAVQIDIYEDSDFDADGSVVTAYNNNRNSANTSGLTITTDPTVNSDGTLIFSQHKGANKQAGLVSRSREIILKQNTKYIFRITNSSTSTNAINWCAQWYEHTSKEE